MGLLSIERKFAWSFSGAIIGIISLIAAVAFFYYSEFRNKIDFKIVIEDEFNIVELNEIIPNLQIIYKDNDIIKEGKKLKVVVYSFENLGEPILQNFYDQINPFKLSFEDSEILKTEIVSSNSEYLQNNFLIEDTIKSSIYLEFNKVIFERNKKITLKSYLMQPEQLTDSKINLEGKILGIDEFNIIRKENIVNKDKPQPIDSNFVKIFAGVYLGLIILLAGLILIIDFIEKRQFEKFWKKFISSNPELLESEHKKRLGKIFNSPKRQKVLSKIIDNNDKIQFAEFIKEITPNRGKSILSKFMLSSRRYRILRIFEDSMFDFEGEGVSIKEEFKPIIIKFLEQINLKEDSD